MKKCLLELMERRPVVVPHFIRDNLGLIPVGDGFTDGSDGKESACNAGDLGSISGPGRSLGEGNGYLLQYSCLDISMELLGTVYGITKSRTLLRD